MSTTDRFEVLPMHLREEHIDLLPAALALIVPHAEAEVNAVKTSAPCIAGDARRRFRRLQPAWPGRTGSAGHSGYASRHGPSHLRVLVAERSGIRGQVVPDKVSSAVGTKRLDGRVVAAIVVDGRRGSPSSGHQRRRYGLK